MNLLNLSVNAYNLWVFITANSQIEVFFVYFIAGEGILLRNLLYHALFHGTPSGSYSFFLDFSCTILPMLLAQTILGDHLLTIIGTLLVVILLLFLKHVYRFGLRSNVDTNEGIYNGVSWFRTMVFISTSIAILAVDFNAFPKRFAKTEKYGHSVMDSGTAAFVFVNALSDFRAFSSGVKNRSSHFFIFGLKIPALFVLLLLGIGRSAFILLSGYHQSVTEYGVHWNFFVTLFFLRLFVCAVNYPYSIWTGLFIGIFYEISLKTFLLEEWILHDDSTRTGLLDENKEGVFSMFGYIFLYSLGLIYARVSTSTLRSSGKQLSIIWLFCGGLSFWLLYLLIQLFVEAHFSLQPSRRLANMPYSLAMASLFSISVSGLQLFNYFVQAPECTKENNNLKLTQAISRNGLVFFLAANLITGLVNITCSIYNSYVTESALQTAMQNDVFETIFLTFYVLLLSVIVIVVNEKRKIKKL